jgi:hypothetical protein
LRSSDIARPENQGEGISMTQMMSAFQGATAAMTQVIGAFKNAMLGSSRVQASRWTVASSDLRLVEMPKRREPSAEWRLMMAQCTAHRDILTGGNDQAVGAFVAGGGDLTWHNPAPVPALPVNEPEPVAMPAVMYGMDEHGRYQAIPVPGGSVEGVHVHTVTMGAGPDGVEFSAEVTMDEESFQRIHALLVGQAEQALFADVGWVDIPAPSGSRTANLGRMLVDVERRVRDAAQMADQAAPLNDVVAVARAIHRMEKNLDKVDFRYRSTIICSGQFGRFLAAAPGPPRSPDRCCSTKRPTPR